MVWLLPCLALTVATPRVTEVSLFQNGYALVRREIDVAASGEVRIDPLPQGVLGTFRFAATPGVTIQSVTADEEIRGTPVTTDAMDELLGLNVGRRVSLLLTDGRTVEGEVVRASGGTVVLRDGTRERTFAQGLVKEIASDTPLNRATERKATVRSLRLRVEATRAGKIEIRSLETGLGWVPTYEARIEDDRNLRLIGRATIGNDLVDLEGAAAELLTGAPNLRFSRTLDPLVSEGRIWSELTTFQGGRSTSGLVPEGIDFIPYDPTDNSLVPSGLFRGGPGAPVSMPPVGQAAGTVEEIFRHRLPALTLRKGGRAQVTLFDVLTPYREIYTWDVALSDDPQPLWRTVRFTNASGRPFAPGPATVVRDDRILGQDALRSTQVKAEAELRLTPAADVRGEVLESETERTPEPAVAGAPPQFRVKVTGTLRLTNGKDRSIPVRIRRIVAGDVTDPGGATVRKSVQGLRQANPVSELTWTLDLPAGQTRTLTYGYEAVGR
jgi:hypothetical protein